MHTGVYVYPPGAVTGVKVADRVPVRGESRPLTFKENIMRGYRREEEKGGFRSAHKASEIKKLWN